MLRITSKEEVGSVDKPWRNSSREWQKGEAKIVMANYADMLVILSLVCEAFDGGGLVSERTTWKIGK